MPICQIIVLLLYLFALLLAARDHGQPKKGFNNFWIAFIALIVNMSLLSFGGFFKPLLMWIGSFN